MGTPATFGLCEDIPDAALDAEWQALVSEQAHTLTAMLHRGQSAAAGMYHPTKVQALATDAERLLTVQAQQHIILERELAQLRALVTDLGQAPATLTQQVQTMECAIEVLHANLTATRRWMATLTTDAT